MSIEKKLRVGLRGATGHAEKGKFYPVYDDEGDRAATLHALFKSEFDASCYVGTADYMVQLSKERETLVDAVKTVAGLWVTVGTQSDPKNITGVAGINEGEDRAIKLQAAVLICRKTLDLIGVSL